MERNNIGWIQSLRGLCALFVFFSHMDLPLGSGFSFIIGRIGVVGFFMITGYLSPRTREKRQVKQYMVNRFFRMYPTYWILLLLFYVLNLDKISIPRLIANFTLFNEFVGFDCIIGSSWMMPIQVVFFILVAFFWQTIQEFENYKFSKNIAIICGLAICTSLVRYYAHVALPTAFFLLLAVSFVGLNYYCNNGTKIFAMNFSLFEMALLLSSVLSYGKSWILYLVSYNIGICLFLIFKYAEINIKFLNLIGEIGFTFFLGTAVTNSLLDIVWFNLYNVTRLVQIPVQFVSAIVFAFIIHYFIETPIIVKSKEIEQIIRYRA